jgi:ABC-2 type transport system permease protein
VNAPTNTLASQMSSSRLLAAYLGDIKFEFTKMRRTPAFALPTLLFPAMFYLLFGVIMAGARGNTEGSLYAFAGLSVFGTMAPGLFGFGVSLAFEREYGLLTFKQALPMPPGAYLIARMAMAMIFASIISLSLILLAKFAGHVPLTWGKAASVYLVGVLGVLPFCAIGLCIGALVSGQAAPAIVNVIYIPMAFLSGLWVPMQFLPNIIKQMAPLWPAYHLAQLSLHALEVTTMGTTLSHFAALAGVTIVFFTIAMRRLSNSGLRMFGVTKNALLGRGIFFLGVGLIVFGVMGGQTVQPATSASAAAATADGAPAASASAAAGSVADAPPGIPAPAVKVLGDFDAGSTKAPYGEGWNAEGDAGRKGTSHATQRLVEGGAQNSKGALEVSGSIGDTIQYPTAGTWLSPAGIENGKYMDFSAKKTLRFFARGDGRSYKVFVVSGVHHENVAPGMFDFQAGPEWQEYEVPIGVIGAQDLTRVQTIGFAAFQRPGDFRFQIDNVRLE